MNRGKMAFVSIELGALATQIKLIRLRQVEFINCKTKSNRCRESIVGFTI